MTGKAEFLDHLLVFFLVMVGHLNKVATEEGVKDGTQEDDGGDDVESALLGGAVFQLLPDSPIYVGVLLNLVLGEGEGEFCVLIVVESKFTFGIGGRVFRRKRRGTGKEEEERGSKREDGKGLHEA